MNKKTKTKRPPKRPPKRGATLPGDRPIDRLQPADRELVRANVAAFIVYVQSRRRCRHG